MRTSRRPSGDHAAPEVLLEPHLGASIPFYLIACRVSQSAAPRPQQPRFVVKVSIKGLGLPRCTSATLRLSNLSLHLSRFLPWPLLRCISCQLYSHPLSIVYPGSLSRRLNKVNGIFLQNPKFHKVRTTCDVSFKMIKFPRFLEVSEFRG